uniref:Tripartite motif-containing protein 5-like n=1 Tax=Moschus moschiferus TaxID=68415 RepID=A0A8C6D296_MOSMO
MASEKLVNLQEEVTCPICLELLKEPLSLDCGHSFCQICITANSKKSVTGQEGERKCPVCRINFESGKLRPNWHLANIVQRVREVKLSLEEQEKHLCVHHGEKLLLFCEEDGKVICWLCERSQEHRGHATFLMEEVAQEYQKKLQTALERLNFSKNCFLPLSLSLLKNQTQHERQNVQAEFRKLRVILDSEERKELQKLKAEETAILCTMENSEDELVQQSQLVRNLISDIEHRLQGSTMQMLQVRMWTSIFVIPRSKTLTLKKPKQVPKEQRSVFRAPDLRDILRETSQCHQTTLSHYLLEFFIV